MRPQPRFHERSERGFRNSASATDCGTPLFVAGAFEAAARLSTFPRLGRVVPEIGDDSIRELIYRQYRILYVVVEDTAEVLTVYPSARQFGGFS